MSHYERFAIALTALVAYGVVVNRCAKRRGAPKDIRAFIVVVSYPAAVLLYVACCAVWEFTR